MSDVPVRSPDFGRSRVARYLQLATLFRNRIASGHWPVGGRIPNIDDLAQDFGVARETIRQALDVLEQEKLLERLRAKGTFVRRSPNPRIVHNLETNWSAIATAHEGAVFKVLESRAVDHLPEHLPPEGGTPAPRYRMMRRLHLREGSPYLLGTFFLDERLYRRVPTRRFAQEPTLRIIEDIAGTHITRAHQTVTIGMADVEMAFLLELAINAPVAHVRRFALDQEQTLIYISDGIYRGDTLRLEIDLR